MSALSSVHECACLLALAEAGVECVDDIHSWLLLGRSVGMDERVSSRNRRVSCVSSTCVYLPRYWL